MILDDDISRLLPHRYPFLLVDRVVEFEAERRIVAVKNVTLNEPHFPGHFPARPLMPGVLLCEALAQAGGLLVQGSLFGSLAPGPDGKRVFLVLAGLDNVKFRRQVVPGDQVRLEVTLTRCHRPLWKMHGVAVVDGHPAAQADLSMVEVDEGSAPVRGEEGSRAAAGVRIHSTAVVAQGAQLDSGVEVGPYAIIGPHVRVGKGSRIGSHASIDGHTTMGEDNEISPFATVGSIPQDLKYHGEDSRLLLGSRNRVREFASLSLGTEAGGMETVVGDDNLFMNYSHVGHDCRIANHAVLANSTALAGHVDLGDYVIVSGLAAVAQFVRVGESAFIGGGSMVVMDVPPFCMANGDRATLKGLNLVGLERRGFAADDVKSLKRAYKVLFQSKLLARDAVVRIREEIPDSVHATKLAEFVASSERGVTRP